jgi:hypothetical protein
MPMLLPLVSLKSFINLFECKKSLWQTEKWEPAHFSKKDCSILRVLYHVVLPLASRKMCIIHVLHDSSLLCFALTLPDLY